MNNYDKNKKYFDVFRNNLYGQTVPQWLPLHEFKWLTNQEIGNLDVHKIPSESNYGNILEVVLE